jgi:hypothetical protein
MVYRSSVADHLRVEVKHRCPAQIDIPGKLFANMKFFHWRKPAIGSAHGKRQVKLERKRYKALRKLIDQAQRRPPVVPTPLGSFSCHGNLTTQRNDHDSDCNMRADFPSQ